MNIMDLDEEQGLTAEMVRDYLAKLDWQNTVQLAYQLAAPLVPIAITYSKDGQMVSTGNEMASVIETVARVEKRNPQAVLRDINPRMRKGKPSAESIIAHRGAGGVWIASHGHLGCGGSIAFVSFDESRLAIWDGEEWHYAETELTDNLAEWSFWPCDAAGNKVRWPERDGVML